MLDGVPETSDKLLIDEIIPVKLEPSPYNLPPTLNVSRKTVAPETFKASFKNGVLNIDIPKVEPELPKKIFVKIS